MFDYNMRSEYFMRDYEMLVSKDHEYGITSGNTTIPYGEIDELIQFAIATRNSLNDFIMKREQVPEARMLIKLYDLDHVTETEVLPISELHQMVSKVKEILVNLNMIPRRRTDM